jgi:hypothetical protein
MGILAFISVFTMNVSFAASDETIDECKTHRVDTYNKKIVSVNHISKWNKNYNGKYYLNIDIKKTYKSKYKLKSIKIRYNDYWGDVKYKTYNIKNKTKVNLNINGFYVNKLMITYQTKDKIKNETLNMETKHNWKSTTHFYGKKANIILKESGYATYSPQGAWPTTNYQKFKITTKSKNYKINVIKAFFFVMGGIESIKTYKGYGKTTLVTRIYGTYEAMGIGAFRVYYY